MAHAYYHAVSSAKKFGGTAEDYLHLHEFMDHTKAHMADNRHRLFLHNAWGIFFAEAILGKTITLATTGKQVPMRTILEHHVKEDFGGKRIPTLGECFFVDMDPHFDEPKIGDTSTHCLDSVMVFGGKPSDYIYLHAMMDSVRNVLPDHRSRCVLHNTWGISMLARLFGETWLRPSDGVFCSTRTLLEIHVAKDMNNSIPTMQEAIEHIPLQRWMYEYALPLSQQLQPTL